jgi:hypothetical protein
MVDAAAGAAETMGLEAPAIQVKVATAAMEQKFTRLLAVVL